MPPVPCPPSQLADSHPPNLNGDTADDASTKPANDVKDLGLQRPFPWNAFEDSTYKIMGMVTLFFIIIPSMAVIFLSNVVGYGLQYALYEYNPIGRAFLEGLRSIQRQFFIFVGHYILLDPRDASYLPWMVWGSVIQPVLFYWVYQRYQLYGLEISTFLIYHLLRVGPRHQMFAHHATLVHKEGHAIRHGLFCNIFKSKRQPVSKYVRKFFTDHVNAGIAGVLYGTIPNHYATAHNKIHHRWHNDTGDLHTNMDFDRTLLESYVMYLPRFVVYWTGLTPVILFWSRGEYKLLMDLVYGMVYYYVMSAVIWYKMGALFYWAYIVYPLLEGASFLGIIAYLWHSFSEESDPSNQYVNSITILRGGNNVWNEDYHVVHHHEPNVHWTDMPESFESQIDKYVECRASVFGDCEQGQMIYWMFAYKWDDLTDHFVDLQYVFADGTKNKDRRLTVSQVAEVEASHKTQEEIAKHHQEVKDMLLRRLKYHYMGTRQSEWRQYNAKLNANVRDFEKMTEDKQS